MGTDRPLVGSRKVWPGLSKPCIESVGIVVVPGRSCLRVAVATLHWRDGLFVDVSVHRVVVGFSFKRCMQFV